MSDIAHSDLSVALVFGDAEASAHLRDAVQAIGARIVCDTPVSALDPARIDDSGAGVVLVNLDDDVGEHLDQVYDALDENRFRVVFNDPDISHGLTGWEHARWLRHLAAKLRDDDDIDPPRPAEALPPASPVDGVTDAWMNEALDVLGEVGAADAGAVPDVAHVVDVSAIDLSFDEPEPPGTEAPPAFGADAGGTETFDIEPDAELAAEAAAEPTPDAVAEFDIAGLDAAFDAPLETLADDSLDAEPIEVADTPQDADSSDAGLVIDSATWRYDEEPDDVPLDTDSVALSTASAAEPDLDLDALEAEIDAAFGSDTLAALDEAGAQPAEATVEPATDFPAGLSVDEPVDVEDAREIPTPVETPDATVAAPDFTLADDDAPPPPAPAPAAPAFSFNVDHLALLDMEPDVPDLPPREAVEHRLEIDRRSIEKARAAEAAAHAQAQAESAETGHIESGHSEAATDAPAPPAAPQPDPIDASAFGIELMTAADYLAPDAPPDEDGREVTAPERMSLDEAVAPRMHDEIAPAAAASQSLQRVVVLGASIGGPDAVREFLSALPERFPATFLLVQHIGSEFVNLMINQLGKASPLPVRLPGAGERALPGEVLVVPHGQRLRLPRSGEVELVPAAGDAGHDPSINDTMTMVAENFGEDAIAVVFSGMAGDAVSGALEIAARGGAVWAQEPASCVVSTMVDGVIGAGIARFVGTPRALAEHLVETLGDEANP